MGTYKFPFDLFGDGGYMNNADHEWEVESDCDQVRIYDTYFDTEPVWDYLTIGDKRYSGNDDVDEIVESSFTINFHSDAFETRTGFVLEWECYIPPTTTTTTTLNTTTTQYTGS